MGFSHFTKLIQNTFPLTEYDLMEKKISLIWKNKLKRNTIEF
jgi:hypothetical protein